MVRASDIQEKLLHLIGWKQDYNISDFKINDSLTTSESGLYFQQIHPLLTLQNLLCIAPDFNNIKYQEFSYSKAYTQGEVVRYKNKLYRANSLIRNVAPDNSLVQNLLEDLGVDWSFENGGIGWVYDGTLSQIFRIKKGSAFEGEYYLDILSSKYSELKSNAFKIKGGSEIKFKFYVALNPQGTMSSNGVIVGLKDINDNAKFLVNKVVQSKDILANGEWSKFENSININEDTTCYISISTYSSSLLIDAFSIELVLADDFVNPWKEIDPFSEWLEEKTKASIQKAIVRYCNEKIASQTNKPLCENRTLFDGTGRLSDVVKNRKNLVGFEIVPIRAKGVVTKINKIGLQFTQPGEYKLYLMHSSADEPIKVITLTKTSKNSTEWFSMNDLYLPYQSDNTDAGGSWYLCYKQSELPEGSQAIKKDKDWSKEPCASCSRNELIAWKAWSKYLEIHPFKVNETDAELNDGSIALWDIALNNYTYDNNYGLNLEITVSCDITDFIVEQKMMFVDVIAKQVAIDMLREFAYNANVRTNRHSINASRLDILYEIDGDSSSMKKSGLNYQLDMAFEAIKLSTTGIDRVCLPCRNNGIKYKTI